MPPSPHRPFPPTAGAAPSPLAESLKSLAVSRPDDLAVADERRTLTFAELEDMAAALAARLEPPDATATGSRWMPIVVDRSAESVVALMASVRAGVPFTPIESTMPPLRIAELFERLGRPDRAVITKPSMKASLPVGVSAIPVEARTPLRVEPQPIDPDGAGLLVFTSGSSGQPKGVVRRWKALARSRPREGASDAATTRVAQLRPFSFMAGILRLGSIGQGDSLHIADPAALDVADLLRWLDENDIGASSFGTAIASTILRHSGGRRLLPQLRSITMGGQPAWWDLVPPLRALASPELTITSALAASEVGQVMRYGIGPDHPVGAGPLPLGTPVGDIEIRLDPLDDDPSIGELVVANPESLGYFDDPDLTRQRYVVESGTTWWRSGDMLQLGDDGLYYHRGRVDDMVKINGFRVEPAEAERALRAIPGIAAASVLVHTGPSGKQRLVGHVVTDDPDLRPEQVRAALDQTLPSQLVPRILVKHPALPINERAKVDRAALLAGDADPWRSTDYRPPQPGLETWVTDHLGRVLDLDRIGPDDDIWQLGLDSLGAVEFCTMVASAGLGTIAPTVLLQHRTPAAVTKVVAESRVSSPSSAVVLNAEGRRRPLFLIPGGGGSALAFRSLSEALGSERPIVAIEPRGLHQGTEVDRTMDAIVGNAMNEVLPRIEAGDPVVIGGYSAGATTAFELAQRLHARGHRVHLIMLDTAPGPSGGAVESLASRVADRSLRENLQAIPRSIRRRIIARRPGAPRNEVARYDAFRQILSQANRTHPLVVVDFPATLIHIEGRTDLIERCRRWLPDLEVRQVGGDHYTMLAPPHVATIADAARSVFESVEDISA